MTQTALFHHLDHLSFLLDTSYLSADARRAWALAELAQIVTCLVALEEPQRTKFLAYLYTLIPFPLCQALGVMWKDRLHAL
ncbi:MAG: hypothetical protein H0T73_14085 [Ardenticatenales bacterium]|nr:hypothetical protein [Ardenticatenales bacterium]